MSFSPYLYLTRVTTHTGPIHSIILTQSPFFHEFGQSPSLFVRNETQHTQRDVLNLIVALEQGDVLFDDSFGMYQGCSIEVLIGT